MNRPHLKLNQYRQFPQPRMAAQLPPRPPPASEPASWSQNYAPAEAPAA